MKHFKKKDKPANVEPKFVQVTDSTLSVNASAHLPGMPFIDPKAVQMPNVGYLRQRIILENMTHAIKKNQFPIMIIVMGLIFGAIAVSILWSSVGKPYLEATQNFELKKLQGNLTSADKPPSLFSFKLPNLPMIGGGGRPSG